MYGITTAETSHMQEITRRQKQYILTMLVRVVSIIVVVVVPGISWPLKVGLCLVATIIPYVAVVRANGGPSREQDPTNLMLGPRHGELGSAQPALPGAGETGDLFTGEYIVGERVTPADQTSRAHQTDQAEEAGRASQDSMADEPAAEDPERSGQEPSRP